MTTPTSPGVVPADVRELGRYYQDRWTNGGMTLGAAFEAAIMADRANRPSLTEDERGQDPSVGDRMREAIIAPYRNDLKGMDDAEIVGAINHARGIIDEEEPWLEALVAEQERRALADRSEPRQEKEGEA